MVTRRVSRAGLCFAAITALAIAGVIFPVRPALAALDCDGGSEIYPGVCELTYVDAGSFSFTAPPGVTSVSAVVVGAGGGSNVNLTGGGGFAGGGGEVVYVDSVSTSGPVNIEVGAAGLAVENGVSGQPGGDTSVGPYTARGGNGGGVSVGGSSGNDHAGSAYLVAFGAGGGTDDSATACLGGAGTTLGHIATNPDLFPLLMGETTLGSGGSCFAGQFFGNPPLGHGGDIYSETEGDSGTDGAVFIRWEGRETIPILPDTGSDWAGKWTFLGVLGLLLIGSGLVIRRTKRTRLR